MSKLVESYLKIKPAIVAIASKSLVPEIIGTGFIIREDGLILTSKYVVDAISHMPKSDDEGETNIPAMVMLFHIIAGKGMLVIQKHIKAISVATEFAETSSYERDLPDIGIVCINVKGLPAVTLAENLSLAEGEETAIAGFPMGTNKFAAPTWLNQVSPTLQKGILSAILPSAVHPTPPGFLLDMPTCGGSSGSAVFRPKDGKVIGMLSAKLAERDETSTPFSLAISNNRLQELIKIIYENPVIKEHESSKKNTLAEIIQNKLKQK